MEWLSLAGGLLLGALVALVLRGRAPADVTALAREVRHLKDSMVQDTTFLAQRLEGLDSRMMQSQIAGQDMAQSIFHTLGDLRSATDAVAEQARGFTALQDLLRAPKARGGLGEAMLAEMLGQILPPAAYSLQHRFSSGVVVDAVVRAGDRLVCIDSKFPLENYRRACEATDDLSRADAERSFAADVERHARAISSRYILPDEGTLDFAVMYVPAEGVYGEVLRMTHGKRSVYDLAMAERVIPMSPLTMFGYLQTVLFGLRCLQIESNAQEILDFCGRLQQEMTRFAEEYEVLGKHLGNARARHEDGARRLNGLRYRLDRVADLPAGDLEDDGTALEVVDRI